MSPTPLFLRHCVRVWMCAVCVSLSVRVPITIAALGDFTAALLHRTVTGHHIVKRALPCDSHTHTHAHRIQA